MTATIAWLLPEGIVLASDSRRSAGSRIISDHSRKLFQLAPLVGCLHSGYAGKEHNEIPDFLENLPIRETTTPREVALAIWEHSPFRWSKQIGDDVARFTIAGYENDLPVGYEVEARSGFVTLTAYTNNAGTWIASGEDMFIYLAKSTHLFDSATTSICRAIELIRFTIRQAESTLLVKNGHSSIGGKLQIAVIAPQAFRWIEKDGDAEPK